MSQFLSFHSFPDADETIHQFRTRQGTDEFIRSISDHVESVGFLPDSTVRFWYNDSTLSYDPHWHNACEMIIPVEGHYLVTIGPVTYDLKPGDIFLIPSGELHSLRAPGPGGRFIFLFEFDMLWQPQGASYLASCLTQPVIITPDTCPSIYNEEITLVHQLCLDYLENDSLRDITIYTRLLTLFLSYAKFRLSNEGNLAMTQYSHASQKSYAEKISAVLAYLDVHFAEELTLEQVAAVAGFSKFHFSRTFKQLSGYNFYDYLCRRRIKSSEILLMKPGLSISQIALQSGFSSVSTFNRTFKKMKGCTPTEYRGMFQVRPERFQHPMEGEYFNEAK